VNLTGNKKGLALTAGSILVLAFLFLLPYHKTILVFHPLNLKQSDGFTGGSYWQAVDFFSVWEQFCG